MLEDAYNGRAGIYAQQNWAGWQVGQTMVRNQGKNSYFVPLDMPTVDGKKIMYPIRFPNRNYHVVRKGYEHPEVLVNLTNTYLYVTDEAVLDGSMTIDEALKYILNDMNWVTGPFRLATSTYRDAQEVSAAVTTGVEKFTSGNAFTYYAEVLTWVNDGDTAGLARYLQMGFPKGSIVLALDHVDGGHLLFDKVWGKLPQAARDLGSTLDDLLVEGYAKIITGAEPISYYDTLIDNWKKAGGDKVTAEVNAMYGGK
jgi:putative aldouronate transport system substrate-binding protein